MPSIQSTSMLLARPSQQRPETLSPRFASATASYCLFMEENPAPEMGFFTQAFASLFQHLGIWGQKPQLRRVPVPVSPQRPQPQDLNTLSFWV
jgi:hypothetical protein